MPILTGVRELRQRTGVRVGAFSELLPCSRSTLVSVENGNRPASIELAHAIVTALGKLGVETTVEQLLTPDDATPSTVPDYPPKQPKGPTGPSQPKGPAGPSRPKTPNKPKTTDEMRAAS